MTIETNRSATVLKNVSLNTDTYSTPASCELAFTIQEGKTLKKYTLFSTFNSFPKMQAIRDQLQSIVDTELETFMPSNFLFFFRTKTGTEIRIENQAL